jgi:membrane protein YqaA with SNARE-associated domain
MTDLLPWLLVWVITVVLNVVPAFMPPTWSVLAYFHLQEDMAIWPLAVVGATAATLGRTGLALASRHFGSRMVPEAWRGNVEQLVGTIRSRKALGLPALALFTLNPIPSNHLFIAAGIARAPLRVILSVFIAGRFVSYVLWVGAADAAMHSLGDVIGTTTGIWAVVVQLVGFAVLILIMRLDWGKLLGRWRGHGPASSTDERSRH